MRITLKEKVTDPVHPIMHGDSPTAQEFNKKQAKLWSEGKFNIYDFEQVCTVLLEMFAEDYDQKHKKVKKSKVK